VSRPQGPKAASQIALGRACKDFLDAGRVAYLESHGFRATLHEYCDKEYTLENHMLVARRVAGALT